MNRLMFFFMIDLSGLGLNNSLQKNGVRMAALFGTYELVEEQGKSGLGKLVHVILSYAYTGVLNCEMNFIGSINLLA